MTDKTHVKLSISDIEVNDKEKRILDTPEKIIWWINHKFEEQQKTADDGDRFYRSIDLSKCIISSHPGITNLCDILIENDKSLKLDCFVYYGEGNKYYYDINEMIICQDSVIYSAFFHNTKFHKKVDFQRTEFNGYASFSGCLFEKNANFQEVLFRGSFDFSYCIFNDSVDFDSATFDTHQVNFEHSVFNGNFRANRIEFIEKVDDYKGLKIYITFYGAIFYQEVKLSNVDFTRDCVFEKSIFKKNIDFIDTNFRYDVSFHEAEINGDLYFSVKTDGKERLEIIENYIENLILRRSIISGRVDVEFCKIKKLDGHFTKITNGSVFRIYKSYIDSLDLTSIHNIGVLILANNEEGIKNIVLTSAINNGVIEVENTTISNVKDRKTARILKDSAFKCGNNIDALKYRAKEMDLYKSESIPLSESILLKLNTWSNNNGLSWIRGILFTLSVWIIFFSSYVMIHNGVGNTFIWTNPTFLKLSIEYLWLFNGLGGTIDKELASWCEIIPFVFGKIFIGYGIFQTISAFRKHGK